METNKINPYFIKFEKPKEELYLTISCLVKSKDSRFLGYQKQLLDILFEENKTIKQITLDKENYKKEEVLIAQYNKDRIHFSLFNILTYELINGLSFESLRRALMQNDFFTNSLEKARGLENKIKERGMGEIRNIYFPQKLENSIAYNLYLDEDSTVMVKELKDYEFGIREIDNNKEKLKIHGDNFAVNVARFINNKTDNFYLESNIYDKIKEINEDLVKTPIKVNFKARLVISNPYLSNEKYYQFNKIN
jgi:hypothetical protein